MDQEEKPGDSVDALTEISAIKAVAEALEALDPLARARVLKWATERYGRPRTGESPFSAAEVRDPGETGAAAIESQYRELADFYAACAPGTDMEKALVVGYWLQYMEGNADLDTQRVNSELKHLGHAIGNITRAFERLTATRPQLVVQTRKSGSTQQARKRLKLTLEGKRAVEKMLAQHEGAR